jgi:endonuclease-3
MALRKKLPKRHWIDYNSLLVAFGQYLCRPVSPKCSVCPVIMYCDRVGVGKSR